MMPDARARKVEGLYDLLTKLQAPVSHLIEQQLFRTSQKITAVSPPVARQVKRTFPHAKRGIDIMWNGVDPVFLTPAKQAHATPGELLFVGRLAPGKGLQDLVQAFKIAVDQFPDARLSIVGDGPRYTMVSSLIERMGLKNKIRLMGHIGSRESLRSLYQQAWGLILSSHHEGLPGVILEAMACGTPVIATRVGGIPDVITDGLNGLLVSPRSSNEIAEAMGRLLKDADLRNRLGQAAERTIRQQFTWQVIGGNFLQCYREISTGSTL
jgi:glycosyltransferase involved in cell wall biosynthesis